MLIVATALVFLYFGWACACRLARGREHAPLEPVVWAVVIAFCSWLASLWIFALLHVVFAPVLLVRTLLFGVAGVLLTRVVGDAGGTRRVPLVWAGAGVVLLAWSAFILWRGSVLPPLSHDALSYHLPKAILLAQHHGLAAFDALDPRAGRLPVNYELLLSEFLVLTKSDALTEWLSLPFYLGLVACAGAFAQRWWPHLGTSGAAAAAILTGGVPVLLLHSGAHKNDLMTAFGAAAGLLTAGRWISTRERFAILLSIASFALAFGTKPHGIIAAVALLPFLAVAWWKTDRRLREFAVALGFALICLTLLGGVAYVASQNGTDGVSSARRPVPGATSLPVVYGDWSNLWEGPYVLLAAPFSSNEMALRVPWQEQPWFWRRYDLYISHAGIPFSLAVLALPFALLRWRGEGASRERNAIVFASLLAFVFMLPVAFSPHGFYAISLPRYVAFLYPVVFGFVVPPLTGAVARATALMAMVAACGSFVWYAAWNVAFDDFVPPRYLRYALDHPGTRVIPFDPNRAASVLDRAAGSRDRVAVETAYSAWLLPAFGADLQRPVELFTAGSAVPEDARWVAIDHGYDVIWGHSALRDLSQVRRFGWKGGAGSADPRIAALLRDPRYEVVFYNRAKSQAVFRRVH